MFANTTKNHRTLEVILVLITAVLTCVLYKTVGFKMIVLNLFYLPVVLAAFFLGRYRAGVLALFSVICATVVTVYNLADFAAFSSPVVVGLAIVVWGAVLGLTAILVGTLSDERHSQMLELHEAHVGVVEVLARYLQSANPKLKIRAQRVAELSQKVAEQMKLSTREVDDVRVAALLYDMENIEITAKVIRKAMGQLEDETKSANQHTFQGTELAHSLSAVMSRAFPLLLNQNDRPELNLPVDESSEPSVLPFGAQIIQAVRAYDSLTHGQYSQPGASVSDVIEELRQDDGAEHHPSVLNALERVVSRLENTANTQKLEAGPVESEQTTVAV